MRKKKIVALKIDSSIFIFQTMLKKIDSIKYENKIILKLFLNIGLNTKKIEKKTIHLPYTP
jgi:hypothetical protein